MSLLLTERLLVTLAPTGVQLARRGGWWRKRYADRVTLPCDTGSDARGWQNALAVLQEALQQPRWQRTPLALTISDRLVRYQLLPWLPELGKPVERLGYARFHFRQVYGALADDWEIRVDEAMPGMPAVACATDQALLTDLSALTKATGVRIHGIYPNFAAVFNRVRSLLPTAPEEISILALLDSGGLCLGVLEGTRWRALRQRSIMGRPAEALRDALEQERLIADPAFGQATVYVMADAEIEGELPEMLGAMWTVRRLRLANDLPERVNRI